MNAAARTFEINNAAREACGLLIGIVGPSSSGKTKSGLRLARGIQRVVGGDIGLIDTENRRALAYADQFRFKHIPFGAPFSPEDYLAAVRFAVKQGLRTIMIDSMSHEHEGPGGVLEWHATETKRLAKLWECSEAKASIAAWNAPKQARRRLINELLQLNVNLIFTFRAKEKIKVVTGKDPIPLGWQPICGEEFMYEFALQLLLPPGSQGRPRWKPEQEAERAIIKLPDQFIDLFTGKDARAQLDEDHGQALAEWAAGGVKLSKEAEELIAEYGRCETQEAYKATEAKRGKLWTKMPGAEKQRVKAASEAALERFTSAPLMGRATLSPQTWTETLNACQTLDQLVKTFEGCKQAFPNGVPNECDAAFQLRREAIGEMVLSDNGR